MTVGVTICTFERPEFAEKCVKSVRKHLSGVIDHLVVVNDGSSAKHNGAYRRVEKATQSAGGTYMAMQDNAGVAITKNIGLRWLLSHGCDFCFTLEDDILITSPKAVTEYVRIATERGDRHYSFAHHGEANYSGPVTEDGEVEYYFHSVGAWVMYERVALLTNGLLDENMRNAFEHVEAEIRMGAEPHRFPDIARSADYLTEIPGSIQKSSIRPRSDWSQNIAASMAYWRDNKPESFEAMFGPTMPLHNYANGILGQIVSA